MRLSDDRPRALAIARTRTPVPIVSNFPCSVRPQLARGGGDDRPLGPRETHMSRSSLPSVSHSSARARILRRYERVFFSFATPVPPPCAARPVHPTRPPVLCAASPSEPGRSLASCCLLIVRRPQEGATPKHVCWDAREPSRDGDNASSPQAVADWPPRPHGCVRCPRARPTPTALRPPSQAARVDRGGTECFRDARAWCADAAIRWRSPCACADSSTVVERGAHARAAGRACGRAQAFQERGERGATSEGPTSPLVRRPSPALRNTTPLSDACAPHACNVVERLRIGES